jgi:hypothetical protein
VHRQEKELPAIPRIGTERFAGRRGLGVDGSCDAAGITLIAIARQDGFEVFTSSHRVTGDGVANAPRLARNGKIARRQK